MPELAAPYARSPNLVSAIEPGASYDMSGHCVDCVDKGEPVGKVELAIQSE
jgi:hypothetical protein